MKGRYNDVYTIDEEIDMSLFLDKTFMLVQGELATQLSLIRQGMVNNSYSPIQVNMDRIAKSLAKADDGCENVDESQLMETKETETSLESRQA